MAFSAKQVQALRRNIDGRCIRTRESNGRELSYLEGWYVISEANRIFGFDGWSRETIESKCVLARESRGSFIAVYTAKVRVTVFADGSTIIREGNGTGEGRGDSPGEVHDTGLKAAETDATKRALATFGRPFGLELYRPSKSERRRRPNGVRGPNGNQGHVSPAPTIDAELGTAPSPSPLPAAEAPDLAPVAKYARDDTTPIPRPSGYYGREHYHDIREETGALVQTAARQGAPAAVLNPGAAPSEKIDKSALPFGEPKRIRDKAHLKFVASQPCLVCGRQPSDAHHLRFAQPRAIGMKVSDEYTVPLCRGHHRQLHQRGNEIPLWEEWQIRPLDIAKRLWTQSHPRLAAQYRHGESLTESTSFEN